jgi:ABC-type transport system involved in multi-copper enzyme maturation permease subunit
MTRAARWITEPAGALFGPIFQREVRSAGRRRSTYIIRGLFVGALLTIVSVTYWGFARSPVSAVERLQELQTLAPRLAVAVLWFQYLALLFAAPLLASPAVCDERRARTLSSLLTTPLTPAQVLIGKLSSCLVQLVILSLLTAPVLLAVRVFGGLGAGLVVAAVSLTITNAVLGAALGVTFSIWHRRATGAAVFALLAMLLLQVAPTAAEAVIYMVNDARSGPRPPAEFNQNVLTTLTVYGLFDASRSAATGAELEWLRVAPGPLTRVLGLAPDALGRVALMPVWAVASAYNLFLAVLVVLGGIMMFGRSLRREDTGEAAADTPRRRWFRRGGSARAPATGPAGASEGESTERSERLRDSRTVSDRPVLWREVRRSSIRSRSMRRALVGVVLVALALLYAFEGFASDGLQMSLAIVGGLAVMVMPVFMTTGGIAAEREARTWETLLTTPLTGREIVLGKFTGALRGLWFVPAVLLAHFVAATVAGVVPWPLLMHLVMIFLGPVLFFSATGQLFSLLFKRGVTAAVMNLLLALVLWAGLWILGGLIGWFGHIDTDWLERGATAVFSLNPVAMVGRAADPAVGMGGVRAGALKYGLFESGPLSLLAFTRWVAGALAFYTAGAGAALGLAVLRFNRRAGRAS